MITSFSGRYRFLSNFWPCTISILGFEYPSVEHAYMAMKTTDPAKREEIRLADSPGKAKRLGRKVVLREGWEEQKFAVMKKLVIRKFHSNPILTKDLVDIGDQMLIEGNTWGDKIWGCVYENGEWVGQNNLGKILMEVREELRSMV